jgi:hypothetical protein
MIYLGVDISQEQFKIAVLATDFTLIDRRNFRVYRLNKIDPWIDLCKDMFDKNVKWFFDEKQFYRCKIARQGTFTAYDNEFYLINHQQLMKITKFIYDYMFQLDCIMPVDRPFLLASASRVIDDSFIKIFFPDGDLPF